MCVCADRDFSASFRFTLSQPLFEGGKREEEPKEEIAFFPTQKQISAIAEDVFSDFWLQVIITSHTLNKTFLKRKNSKPQMQEMTVRQIKQIP